MLCVVGVFKATPPHPPSTGTPLRRTPLRRTAQNFAFFFPLPPQFLFFSPSLVGLVGPPGTAREPKRAHLRVPASRPLNTTKIQRKGPTREGEKNKNCGGGGKQKSKILGGPAEGVRRREVRRRGVQWRGGPAEGGQGKSKPATTITTTTTPNPEQVGPRPLSQARFRVFRGWAQQHTTTNNNTRKFRQNAETTKLAKVGLAKVGQHSKTLKLAKVFGSRLCDAVQSSSLERFGVSSFLPANRPFVFRPQA